MGGDLPRGLCGLSGESKIFCAKPEPGGTTEAAWGSFAGATTLDYAVVCIVTTVSCGATTLQKLRCTTGDFL
jgi:hypothetical protein